MKLYIAGPMRGRQFYNFPAFDAAKSRLEALGHEVVSPADLDRANGFDAIRDTSPDDPCLRSPPGFNVNACISRDVAAVLDCDGVCYIDPCWYESAGSIAEAAVAKWAGKPVYQLTPGGLIRKHFSVRIQADETW